MPRLLIVGLLAAAIPCAFALPPKTPTKPPAATSLSLHGLKKAISHFWDGKKGMLCADCIQLAVEVDSLLYKPPTVESDDPNIAAGPGRRMRLHHKESEIYEALDSVCGQLAESKKWGKDVLHDCQRHIAEHRRSIENDIFDKGTQALASTMCVTLFQLCSPHHLMDSGEL